MNALFGEPEKIEQLSLGKFVKRFGFKFNKKFQEVDEAEK
ncbi:hypothetical protein CM15mP35_03120 [bacterium]|nr:MAG: hypothetical protein CM15mP35_03120 [bacterium]